MNFITPKRKDRNRNSKVAATVKRRNSKVAVTVKRAVLILYSNLSIESRRAIDMIDRLLCHESSFAFQINLAVMVLVIKKTPK